MNALPKDSAAVTTAIFCLLLKYSFPDGRDQPDWKGSTASNPIQSLTVRLIRPFWAKLCETILEL